MEKAPAHKEHWTGAWRSVLLMESVCVILVCQKPCGSHVRQELVELCHHICSVGGVRYGCRRGDGSGRAGCAYGDYEIEDCGFRCSRVGDACRCSGGSGSDGSYCDGGRRAGRAGGTSCACCTGGSLGAFWALGTGRSDCALRAFWTGRASCSGCSCRAGGSCRDYEVEDCGLGCSRVGDACRCSGGSGGDGSYRDGGRRSGCACRTGSTCSPLRACGAGGSGRSGRAGWTSRSSCTSKSGCSGRSGHSSGASCSGRSSRPGRSDRSLWALNTLCSSSSR